MKVAIVIIASTGGAFDTYAKYWNLYMNSHPNMRGYFVYGKNSKIPDFVDKDNVIVAPFPETMKPGILQKTIFALEQIRKDKYDFVFRTNLSSFFFLDRLYKRMLRWKTKRKIYQGVRIVNRRKYQFVSGTGIFMSKDVYNLLIRKKNTLNYKIIDDVSIGIFMKRNGIPLTQGATKWYPITKYSKKSQALEKAIDFPINNENREYYHVRVKNRKSHPNANGIAMDKYVYEKLYNKVYGNS